MSRPTVDQASKQNFGDSEIVNLVVSLAMEAYNIINRTSSEQLQGKLSRHDGKHSERNNANNELYVPKNPELNVQASPISDPNCTIC